MKHQTCRLRPLDVIQNPVNGWVVVLFWYMQEKQRRGGGIVDPAPEKIWCFIFCNPAKKVWWWVGFWAVVTSWSETGKATSYEPGSDASKVGIPIFWAIDKTINPSKSLTTITSTFPETNGSPLKIGPKGKNSIPKPSIFRCYASFREGHMFARSKKTISHWFVPWTDDEDDLPGHQRRRLRHWELCLSALKLNF